MLKKLWLSAIYCLFTVMGFTQFSDNFSDLNFTQNPSWVGQDTNFVVDTANQQLRLMAPAVTSTSFLSTPSSSIYNGVWEYKVKLDFNPSGSNLAQVYLTSDVFDLSNNGYFVRIGNSTDEISLYQQSGGNATEIIDGTDDLIDVSAPEVLVRVTRDSIGNWELLADTSLSGNYVSQGMVFNNTFTVSNYFGVLCDYTSSRSDKFYFDDFTVSGTVVLDTDPPTFDLIKVISQTALKLFFNEPLATSTAQNINNFSVNNGVGNPTSAILSGSLLNQIDLTFSTNFPPNQTLQVTAQNIEDTSGNIMNSMNLPFQFTQVDVPQFKDVLINEFMADPSPPNNLPDAEFIELWNYSNKTFDLQGWQIGDQSNLRNMPSYILKPWEFVIVCDAADSSLFAPFGNVVEITSMPALNNGGDKVRLFDNNSNAIDTLKFDISWYANDVKDDGGFSLELTSPLDPCKTNAQNFVASPSANGGTPGALNAAFDTIPNLIGPSITSVFTSGEDTLTINFDSKMDSASLAGATYDAGGVTFTPISVNNPDFDKVILRSTPKIQKGLIYQLPLTSLMDCYGINLADTTVNFGIGRIPQPFDLVINEFYPDPDETISPDLPEFEFVEIYNRSDDLLELGNTKLSDPSTTGLFPKMTIAPNSFVIAVENGNGFFFRNYGQVAELSDFPSLNNTGDNLSLRNAHGQLLHQVNYNDDWYNDEGKQDGGFTIEQIDPNFPCSGISNWAASTAILGGTPGSINSVKATFFDDLAPEISKVNVLSEFHIRVGFNEPLDSTYSTDNILISINPEIEIDSFLITEQDKLDIILTENLVTKTAYKIIVDGIADCAGNISYEIEVTFGLPETAQLGDIIINELLPNPRRSSGTDYIEIFNTSDKYIDLQNWKIANWDEEKDTIGSTYNISETPFSIAPEEFLCLSKNSQELLEEYPNSSKGTLLEIETLPSFSNDEGTAIILNNSNEITDRFDYNDDLHLAFIDDNNGVALERISVSNATNEPTNWTSAAESENFGTPGYLNSSTTTSTEAEDIISVSPEIFSPDQDGFNDILSINYQFDMPGFVGDLSIYSPRGVLIKQLVNNYVFGNSGSISWAGEDENGRKAAIGIYVVVGEVFDVSGNSEIHKTTCVLGGKL